MSAAIDYRAVHANAGRHTGDLPREMGMDLLALSGPRKPYPAKVGVIETGAHADLLLVDGNPTANLDLIGDPDRNFQVIMKDGVVVKNAG